MRGLLAAHFFAFCGLLEAQLVAPQLKTITTRDGLSDDHVWALAKDQRGSLWIGTKNGLNRYDGRRVTIFRAEGRPNSLPGDHITALAVDTGRILYVGTNAPFLTLFDVQEDTLMNIPLPDPEYSRHGEQRITSLRMDKARRLWIGHGARCLSLFDPATRAFRTTEIPPPLPTPRPREVISFIDEDADGVLWLSLFRGLVRFDPRSGKPEMMNLHPAPGEPNLAKTFHVRGIVDDDSALVFGTWSEGIFRMRKRDGELHLLWPSRDHMPTFVDHMVTNMCRVPGDRAMVATIDQGLLQLDLRTGNVMHFDRSLTEKDCRKGEDLFAGCYRLLAIADALVMGSTMQGVAIWPLRNRAVQPVQLPPHPGEETIDMVVGASRVGGAIHVLSQRRGLFIYDTVGTLLHHAGTDYHPDQRFESMIVDTDGSVLLGATPRSLEALPGQDRLSLARGLPVGTPCADAAMWISEDGHGGLWYMAEHGLHHWNKTTGRCVPLKEEHPQVFALMSGWPWDVFVDGGARSWFLSANSPPVVLHPDGRAERVTGPPELAPFEVSDIARTPDGRLWLAVKHRGLVMIEAGEGEPIKTTDVSAQLPSRNIMEVVAMTDGSLWMSQPNTIMHWDPVTGAARVLSVLDGVAPGPLNLDPDHAPVRYPLLVGTWEGFYMIHEAALQSAGPPRVHVPTVLLGDSALMRHADLGHAAMFFPTGPDRITFLLRTDNLIDPQRDEIAYRLVGLDTAWSVTRDEERLSFNHLDPGHYRFEVKARTGQGAWGVVTVVPFVVPPPFWATWWFRTALAIAGAVCIWGLFQLLLRRKMKKERERSERERAVFEERIRIARDLHDDLGSGLASIGMESELAVMEASDAGTREAFKRVSESARNVGDDMRRIIWAMGSGQETLGDLVAYVRGFAGEMLDQAGVEFAFAQGLPDPGRLLSVEQRKHLVLFTKEALHNVVKHAGARQVHFMVVSDSAKLLWSIRDDGRGYDRSERDGMGTGTISMRERARDLKADLAVESAPGNGTAIELRIPL